MHYVSDIVPISLYAKMLGCDIPVTYSDMPIGTVKNETKEVILIGNVPAFNKNGQIASVADFDGDPVLTLRELRNLEFSERYNPILTKEDFDDQVEFIRHVVTFGNNTDVEELIVQLATAIYTEENSEQKTRQIIRFLSLADVIPQTVLQEFFHDWALKPESFTEKQRTNINKHIKKAGNFLPLLEKDLIDLDDKYMPPLLEKDLPDLIDLDDKYKGFLDKFRSKDKIKAKAFAESECNAIRLKNKEECEKKGYLRTIKECKQLISMLNEQKNRVQTQYENNKIARNIYDERMQGFAVQINYQKERQKRAEQDCENLIPEKCRAYKGFLYRGDNFARRIKLHMDMIKLQQNLGKASFDTVLQKFRAEHAKEFDEIGEKIDNLVWIFENGTKRQIESAMQLILTNIYPE